jgi:hypothetical protein
MNLPATPTDSALTLAGAVWVETLWERRHWYPDTDPPRLSRAFTALASHARRWPAPADLLDHLPARLQPPALPPPAARRTGQAHLIALRACLRRGPTRPPGTPTGGRRP